MIDRPELLLGLIALVPLALISYRRYLRGLPGLLAIAGGTERQVSNLFLVRWFFGTLLFLLGMAGALVALAGIRWGTEPPEVPPAAVEVVLLFDISRSMSSVDVAPSRLGRSVAAARSIVREHEGSPFGIVVFRGEGEIFLPVTRDRSAIDAYLDAIDTGLATAPGTDIGAGLERAALAFPPGTDARRIVVLFSDGGNLSGRVAAGAQVLADEDVSLVVAGVGGAEPVPIPLEDGYIVDEEGARVYTSLDSSLLAAVAEAASGTYLDITSGELLDHVADLIGSSRPVAGRTRDRYRIPLLGSILCFGLWVFLRTVKWRGLF